MKTFISAFAAGLGLMLLMNCSSRPKPDWNERIGTYTFDYAVTELGPPDRSTELSNGKKVAEWDSYRDSHLSLGLGTGWYGRGSAFGIGTSVSPYSGREVLRLTFDKEGVLRAWEPTYK